MVNQVDSLFRNPIDGLQESASPLAHHNHPVRQGRQFVHDLALCGVRLFQNGVKGGHDGHAEFAEQLDDVAPRHAPEDAELVLQTDHVDVVDVQEFGRAPVRGQFLVPHFKTDPRGIVVPFLHIVHGNREHVGIRVRLGKRLAHVSGERRYPALARKVISDKSHPLIVLVVNHSLLVFRRLGGGFYSGFVPKGPLL